MNNPKPTQENLKFKTREEIANEFGISTKTMRRRLKKAGISIPNGLLSIKEQQVIYELFGHVKSLMILCLMLV